MTDQLTTERDLTVKDVAAELGCSAVHVYRMLKAGKLRAYKAGRNTRIPRTSLDELKAGNPWRPVAQRGADEDRLPVWGAKA